MSKNKNRLYYYNKNTTLCWYCANACGKCSWSSKFQEVEGWEANKGYIKNHFGEKIPSYVVKKCPQFCFDGKCLICKRFVKDMSNVDIYYYFCPFFIEDVDCDCKNYI